MYVKQFETFQVRKLIEWANHNIYPGFRFQFKSPSFENSLKLYKALIEASSKPIEYQDKISGRAVQLYGIELENCLMLPVLHRDSTKNSGFTDEFISNLRDQIAGQNGIFLGCSLLIVHNSYLDTLINSSEDLAAQGAVWSVSKIKQSLSGLIDLQSSGREVSQCLLDYQFDVIREEDATMFGFEPLYDALDDGELEFREIGLLPDPVVLEMNGNKEQIKKRLENNRELYKELAFEFEHYSDQIDERLKKKYGEKFRKKITGGDDTWKMVSFQEHHDEIDRNKTQGIYFAEIEPFDRTSFFCRSKSLTKAGKRDQHIICWGTEGLEMLCLKLSFSGDPVRRGDIKITGKDFKCDQIRFDCTSGPLKSYIKLTIPNSHQTQYFNLKINRERSSEVHNFRFLILPRYCHVIGEIQNCFLVEPIKKRVKLRRESQELIITSSQDESVSLSESGQVIDSTKHSKIDYSDMWESSDLIEFSITSRDMEIAFCVEPPPSQDTLGLPLSLNKIFFDRLFDDNFNACRGDFKDQFLLDGQEFCVKATRSKLMTFETEIVDNGILSTFESTSFSLKDLERIDEDIFKAYSKLFRYYEERETLPSLVSWGPEYRAIVNSIIKSVFSCLSKVPEGGMLSEDIRQILSIGSFVLEGNRFWSPLHPIILSYYLMLFNQVCEDKSGTFNELPSVTLDRLNPVGMIPYIYDPEHEYACLYPLPENRMWACIEPQEEASLQYVGKLVFDKLTEFKKAYSSLFEGGESPILVNAINLGDAKQLFKGVVRFFQKTRGLVLPLDIHFYDNDLTKNAFDRFCSMESHSALETFLHDEGDAGKDSYEGLIQYLRKSVTYSRNTHSTESQRYCHISFFKNAEKVDIRSTTIKMDLSGVACDGLISAEASECKEGVYFTSFGLRNVDTKNVCLCLAELYGSMLKPAIGINEQYTKASAITLAVGGTVKNSLVRAYDSSIWTTIIDPKVTLDFFADEDVSLIHYSDQYTPSTNYDAITVTKQKQIFLDCLREKGPTCLEEFNAFNGTWVLEMLTNSEKIRKEHLGIIGAYKFVWTMLAETDIVWIPISIAEMIRVSGNLGLKMSESDFARGAFKPNKGAISDDILFVGFKEAQVYLLPVEVKTGVTPDWKKAVNQASALLDFIGRELLSGDGVAKRIHRALFIRQVFAQIDSYELYEIMPKGYFDSIRHKREWLLEGTYQTCQIKDYYDGLVVSHASSSTCVSPMFEEERNILKITLPDALLDSILSKPLRKWKKESCTFGIKMVPKHLRVSSTLGLDLISYCMKIDELESPKPDIDSEKPVSKNKENITLKEYKEVQEVIDVSERVEESQGPMPQEATKLSRQDLTAELETKTIPETGANISPELCITFGEEIYSGENVVWEPTNTSKCMNTNTAILGTMGTGKTQFTKSLVTQLIQNQHTNVGGNPIGLLIFDYKSDYVDEEFVQATSATILEPVNIPYNPLSLFGDLPNLPALTARGFSETIGNAYNLGVKQKNRLRTLVMQAYENHGIRSQEKIHGATRHRQFRGFATYS